MFLLLTLGMVITPSTVFADHSVFHATDLEVVEDVEQQGLAEAAALENRGLSLGFVVLAGLIDGTNVCALTLMLLLAGYLIVHVKDRRRSMRIGFIYLITVWLTYFAAGALLAQSIKAVLAWEAYTAVRQVLNITLVSVLALAGVLNLQDFFFSKKFVFDVSSSQRQRIRALLKKIDMPTTVGLGMLSALFLLPCSLPLYLASVGVLAQVFDRWVTLGYVAVYSVMFMVPLLVMLAVLLRAEKVVVEKDIRSERFRFLKLVKAVIQLGAAVGLWLILC